MNVKIYSSLIFAFISQIFYAQHIQYGTNNYIEYHHGNLPIIISVPHDGALTPSSIQDRTCNNPTLVRDIYAADIALKMKDSLYFKTGCYPQIIICNLKRTKLDCNRDSIDGACGNKEAKQAWIEFNSFIDTAQKKMLTKYGNKLIYIDLHAHGHDSQMIELGYLLTASDLNQKDSVLNTNSFISKSSIGNLANSNHSNQTHAELLRGNDAFGTQLWNLGYPAVPSKQMKSPDTFPYFNGGFNTKEHSCAGGKSIANGFQIELNYKGVRDNEINRGKFAGTMSNLLIVYLQKHFNYFHSVCKTTSYINSNDSYPTISIFPNPVKSIIHIDSELKYLEYILSDISGKILLSGDVVNGEIQIPTIEKGVYFLNLKDRIAKIQYQKKLVVE